jgi:hypothetical protein
MNISIDESNLLLKERDSFVFCIELKARERCLHSSGGLRLAIACEWDNTSSRGWGNGLPSSYACEDEGEAGRTRSSRCRFQD